MRCGPSWAHHRSSAITRPGVSCARALHRSTQAHAPSAHRSAASACHNSAESKLDPRNVSPSLLRPLSRTCFGIRHASSQYFVSERFHLTTSKRPATSGIREHPPKPGICCSRPPNPYCDSNHLTAPENVRTECRSHTIETKEKPQENFSFDGTSICENRQRRCSSTHSESHQVQPTQLGFTSDLL